METMNADEVRDVVKARYAEAALRARNGGTSSCCGSSDGCGCPDPITSGHYEGSEADAPAQALRASLGCGNPTLLADLQPGQTVLDLGSGGGLDVLLSARRVGPAGKAYGLDMTDEMLALAEENRRAAGAENVANVEFLKGTIEEIPLPDQSVDVIISNCVINLSGDKSRVFSEALRVLKPGGRFAVSDVIIRGGVPVPSAIRKSMELWTGCVAGALTDYEYVAQLTKAGFEDVSIEITRTYDARDARAFLTGEGLDADVLAAQVDGAFASAFIRATKPAARSACCGPTCCH